MKEPVQGRGSGQFGWTPERKNSRIGNRPLTFLVVTSTFPPRGGSSVQRVAKFCKYAKRNNAEPIVVTADFKGGLIDRSLEDDLPVSLHVNRVATSALSKNNLITKIIRRVSRIITMDDSIAWEREAKKKCLEIIKENKIDVIFISYGGVSALRVGTWLSLKTKIPAFLDIRDLKGKNRFNSPKVTKRKPINDKRLDILEKKYFPYVSGFSVATKTYATILKNYYGIDDNKISVIYNGYDPEDFKFSSKYITKKSNIIFRYIGFITHIPSFSSLIASVGKINQARIEAELSPIEIEVYGANNKTHLQEIIFGYRADSWCHLFDYVDHPKAIELMRSATALILLQHAERGVLTGKLFEYIGAKRPILLLDNNNEELRSFISSYELGATADFSKRDEIIRAIDFLLFEFKNNPDIYNNNIFKRDYQARQFISAMNRATDRVNG